MCRPWSGTTYVSSPTDQPNTVVENKSVIRAGRSLAIEYHDVPGPEREPESLEDATLDHVIYSPSVDGSSRVRPTAEMPPHVTGLPLPHQLKQRRDEVGSTLGLWRNEPEPRLRAPAKIENGGIGVLGIESQVLAGRPT